MITSIGVARYVALQGHTGPPRLPRIYFFQWILELHKSDSDFVRLPLQTYIFVLCDSSAVAQSRLYEPCSVYYFDSFYVQLTATLRWFTAGVAIRIALRQLLQNRKWRHWWRHNLGSRWKLQKWLQRILVLVRSTI